MNWAPSRMAMRAVMASRTVPAPIGTSGLSAYFLERASITSRSPRRHQKASSMAVTPPLMQASGHHHRFFRCLASNDSDDTDFLNFFLTTSNLSMIFSPFSRLMNVLPPSFRAGSPRASPYMFYTHFRRGVHVGRPFHRSAMSYSRLMGPFCTNHAD